MSKSIYPNNSGQFPVLKSGLHNLALGNSTAVKIMLSTTNSELLLGVIGKGSWAFPRHSNIDKGSFGYIQEKLGFGRFDGDAKHIIDFINCQNGFFNPDNVAGNYNSPHLSSEIESDKEIPDRISERELSSMRKQGYDVVNDNGVFSIEPYGYDIEKADIDIVQMVNDDVILAARNKDPLALHACLVSGIFKSDRKIFSATASISFGIESDSPRFNRENIDRKLKDLAEKILSSPGYRKELIEGDGTRNLIISNVCDNVDEILEGNKPEIDHDGLTI